MLRPFLYLLMLAAVLAAAACKSQQPSGIGPALPGEPTIRVRVLTGDDILTFETPDTLLIGQPGEPDPQQFQTPLTLVYHNQRWQLDGQAQLDWAGQLVVAPVGDGPLPLRNRRYPGKLRLVPRPDLPAYREDRTRFDVVNHVHLEAYLPGVLDKELYPGWRPTTFYAQAIAARSYAIHRMLNATGDRHYDVESTQVSQAYIGATDNLRAVQAVLETTGLVLTDGRTVLQAFYSSTCGGAGASPTDAFGGPTHQAPLRPTERAEWCRDSKHFTWGPVRRNRKALTLRIAAWGRSQGHPVGKLKAIRYLTVAERNPFGRPTVFVIEDEAGSRYRLPAESFRVACNFTADGLPDRGPRLKSAFFEVIRRGEQIEFSDAHGFGHGVGLCQFGAQAMAEHGHDVMAILETYYPGALVERAY